MSVNITFDGQPHIVAETGEVGWGGNTTSYLVAIAAGCLQKTGGNFTLSAETDFGASFGLKSLHYKSRTADVAATGILRLANNSDSVSWRNAANSADLALAVNASNQIIFNGTPLATSGGGTVNLGTQFQLGHYAANGTEIAGLALITASRALVSDVNGLPIAATTTAVELAFVSGVTSALQAQLNSKLNLSGGILTGTLTIVDGILSSPGIRFTSENTGFYLRIAGTPQLVVSGVDTYVWNADGFKTTIALTQARDLGATNAEWGTIFAVTGTFSGGVTAVAGTFTGQLQGQGTVAADNATAGQIGETISSLVSTKVNYPTSGQFGDLTSIALTAGDWLVTLYVENFSNGATITDSLQGIGTAAGNDSTGLLSGDTLLQTGVFTGVADRSIPPRRYSISGGQTLYLKLFATYSVATLQATGRLLAVRIR